ncbi:MAG: hypothetical protein J7M19_01895 [Planctomycetes bacterium]|nr:hypothetical protein [Planctomycetota bacterium]
MPRLRPFITAALLLAICAWAWAGGPCVVSSQAAGAAGEYPAGPGKSSAEGARPPLAVTVKPEGFTDARVVWPVEFAAPLEEAAFAPEVVHYLVGPSGDLFACQVEAFKKPAVYRGYRWAHLKVAVPLVEATYTVMRGQGASAADASSAQDSPAVPRVRAQGGCIEAGGVKAYYVRGLFTILHRLDVGAWQAVPDYMSGLINPQQGVRLVLRDRLRHADFVLEPRCNEDGFRLEGRGPVEASAVYEGVFAGRESVDEIPFEARVSLLANRFLRVNVKIPAGAFDEKVYGLEKLVLTVPILLPQATRVTFGGTSDNLSGLAYWEGQARLSLDANESYEFADGIAPPVCGKGPVTWIRYGDREAGVALFWKEGAVPLEFTADYNQDLLRLAVTPVRTDDGSREADVFFLFDTEGTAPGYIAACARALRHPPSATVSQIYLKAVTKAR